MAKNNNPTVHSGKAKWLVRELLNGGDIDQLAAQVKANVPTVERALAVYAIAMARRGGQLSVAS